MIFLAKRMKRAMLKLFDANSNQGKSLKGKRVLPSILLKKGKKETKRKKVKTLGRKKISLKMVY